MKFLFVVVILSIIAAGLFLFLSHQSLTSPENAGCDYDRDVSLQKARFDFMMAAHQGQEAFKNYYKVEYTPEVKMFLDFNFAIKNYKCK